MNKLTIIHETDEGVEKVTYDNVVQIEMKVDWTPGDGLPDDPHVVTVNPAIDLVTISFVPLPNEQNIYGHLEKENKNPHAPN